MPAETATASEFQRRRTATWHATRLWLGLDATAMAMAMATFILFSGPHEPIDLSEPRSVFLLICILVTLVSSAVVFARIQRLYRCPRCARVPFSFWGQKDPGLFGRTSGLLLNPRSCPTCGAILRVGV